MSWTGTLRPWLLATASQLSSNQTNLLNQITNLTNCEGIPPSACERQPFSVRAASHPNPLRTATREVQTGSGETRREGENAASVRESPSNQGSLKRPARSQPESFDNLT